MAFHFPDRPAELAETQLIDAILDGTFPVNSSLPSERELAALLGITRPTLREVLQRLSRDGWIEIHHGKSTRVCDFWQEGSLTILGTISRRKANLPPTFIYDLLQIRALLAPTYFRLAFENRKPEVLELLEKSTGIPDDPMSFTEWDWQLHYRMTILSGNPVFTLILNGFMELYKMLGPVYFANPAFRTHSCLFYARLLNLVLTGDSITFEAETKIVMEESITNWQTIRQI